MRYRLDNHPAVPTDFERILNFIGEYAGYPLARRKVIDIKRSISNLKALPHVGTIRNDVVPGLRAIPAVEKATICFTVNDETRAVKIVCVTYAGQDWQTIARECET